MLGDLISPLVDSIDCKNSSLGQHMSVKGVLTVSKIVNTPRKGGGIHKTVPTT